MLSRDNWLARHLHTHIQIALPGRRAICVKKRTYLVVFFAAGFLVAAGLVAAAFFGAALVAAGFFVAGFVVVVFLAAVAGLTPASLACLAMAALRRDAVFFLIKPFLTALSSSLWALAAVSAVGLAANALLAVLISFLIPTLRSRRTIVCFIRLIALLIIGIVVDSPWLRSTVVSRVIY